jgi:hypothetical protein
MLCGPNFFQSYWNRIEEDWRMTQDKTIASILKYGLLIAAIIIVVRIVLELLGAPSRVNAVFGVAWLYLLLPIVFAFVITRTGASSPFKLLFINLLMFAIYTRIMVWITYMLAYSFRWQAPRFSMAQGGNVGEGVSVLKGILLIPTRNALIWVVFAEIVGMIIGGIIILLRKATHKALPT